MLRDVIVTGLGRVGPQGSGRTRLARALRDAQQVPTHFSEKLCSAARSEPTQAAATTVLEYFAPAEVTRTNPASDPIDRATELAKGAAGLAREESGLGPGDPICELWIATSFGLSRGRPLSRDTGSNDLWEDWLRATGATRLGGTFAAREASGFLALAAAADSIENGRADRALVIEVDTLTPTILRVHRRLRALAIGRHNAPPVARPFDRCRHGSVLAEGATAIVLERECLAADRAARARSRIAWTHQTLDRTASPYGFGDGAGKLASELSQRLSDSGISPRSIEGIVSGARGSVEGDAQEAQWIAGLFGDDPHPPVFAPIGTTGLGGGGLLAAACLAAEGVPLGGSAGHCERDPHLPIRPHPTAVSPTPGRILVSTIATGGEAVWVLLEAP